MNKLEMAKFLLPSALTSLAFALILVPIFREIARRFGWVDAPANNHKRHHQSVPLLGGMAIFAAWALTLAAGLFAVRHNYGELLGADFNDELIFGVMLSGRNLAFLFAGAVLALTLGMLDDLFPLKAGVKFSGQLVAALLAVWGGGVQLDCIQPYWLSVAVTVFWIMTVINAINFFDNMDGLAAGTAAIALAFFGVVAMLGGQFLVAAFCGSALGAVVGFWYYNAAPATIFMGDCGSHFLGYILAVVAVKVTYYPDAPAGFGLPLLMPLFILALPLFDAAVVVVIRTWNRKPFWIGDRNHLSHRFQRMGLSRKLAVTLCHLLSLVIALGILPLYWGSVTTAAVLVAQNLLLLTVVTILQFSLSRTDR